MVYGQDSVSSDFIGGTPALRCAAPLAHVANGEPIRLELRGALAGVADDVQDGPPPDFDPFSSRC